MEEPDLRELLEVAARKHAEELLRTLRQYQRYLRNTPIRKMTPQNLAQVRETTEKIHATEKFLASQRKHSTSRRCQRKPPPTLEEIRKALGIKGSDRSSHTSF